MDAAIALMAKPFIEGLVKDVVIPKVTNFCSSLKQGFMVDYVPKSEHFREYLFRSYKSYSVINTLVQNNSMMELKEIYVPLTLRSVNSAYPKDSITIDGFPMDFFDTNHHVLITDMAGMGKSTITKRMFLDVVDSKYGIPIYIELRRLGVEHDIVSEIIMQLNSLAKDVDKSLVLNLLQTGGFVFFLDGYDEIPISQLTFVTRNIQDFVSKAGDENIYVLTSRPDNSLSCFGNFKTMRINSLTKKQSYELIRKLDCDGETSKILVEKLKKPDYQSVNEFLKNPLLVSLLFAAFDFKPSIPVKKHTFYRQVFDAFFERRDLTKGDGFMHEKKSKLAIDDFDTVMRYLGFDCQKKQKVEFEKDELLKMIRSTQERLPRICYQESDLLSDLLKAVPLFCKDGLFYKWTHKSLQEYFAAEFIYKDAKDHQDAVLSAIYRSKNLDRYLNLLDLYFDIDFVGFQKNILTPFLKDFIEYYESCTIKLQNISQTLLDERIGLLFNKRIFVLNYKDGGEDFEVIIEKYMGKKIKYGIKCVQILADGQLVVEDTKIQDCLIKLLSIKIPELFGQINPIEINFDNEKFEVTLSTFHENEKQYELLNQYVAFALYPTYLQYNAVKKYLSYIERINNNIATRDDLLSGL